MNKKGFTLLEILMIITLISILLGIFFVFVDPRRQIGNINNAQRKSDIFSIYNAINQYRDINSGKLPEGIIANISKNICQPGCVESENQIDISSELEPYISFGKIPIDPKQEGLVITGYAVYVDIQGKVIVSAPLAENGAIINTEE